MTQTHSELKPQEIEILKLVAAGLTNKEIASRVHLALKTVEHMLGTSDPFRSVYLKIRVSNRAAAAAWYSHHFGWREFDSESRSLVDRLLAVYSDYPSRIYQVRTNGQPWLALDIALFLKGQIQSFLQDHHSHTSRVACLHLYTEALVEQALVYLEVMPRSDVLALMQPVFREFSTVAKELADSQVLALGHLALAGAYNIDKQYAAGQKLYHRALELCGTVDVQLRALRGIVISSAFLSDTKQVEYASIETQKRIEGGQFTKLEQVCETVEGVSKARGLLRLPNTYVWFEESEKLLAKLNHHPLRTLQLIVSKLEITRCLEPESVTAMEKLGEQGMDLARAYGYHRHQELIQELLVRSIGK